MSLTTLSTPFALAIVLVSCLACSPFGPEQPLAASIEVSPQVGSGDAVAITLRVTNRSDDTARLETHAANADLAAFNPIVRDDNGVEVWRRYTNPLLDIAVVRAIAPGESIEYRVTWDQLSSAGTRVAAGRYSVSNWPQLRDADVGELRVKSETFRIVP